MTLAAITTRGMRVTTEDGRRCVIDDASLELAAGEVLGVVGESGSGKTTLGLALLNHCRRGLRLESGSVRVGDTDLLAADAQALRSMRGRLLCYVPQDPASALNPSLRIGTQLAECLPSPLRSAAGLVDLLTAVKLPADGNFLASYPHQLSGGQIQRVAIAMAFANRPRFIVMDEPTTGLDVTTQAHVLETIRQLCAQYAVAALYVSHDIAVVAAIAHRVAVVYAGRIVEIGPTEQVLRRPAHPYTRALIRAVPNIDDGEPVSGIPGQAGDHGADIQKCSFVARCALAVEGCAQIVPPWVTVGAAHEVRCLRAHDREDIPPRASHTQPASRGHHFLLAVRELRARHGRREVLHGITFGIAEGECVGLVGESGSGKTTLARCLAGLHVDAGGSVEFGGERLPLDTRLRTTDMRRRIQYIFQNPYASFNPRRSIGASLAVAMSQFGTFSAAEQRRKVTSVLDHVSLPASTADRYPRDLSGGQRQRAAIARALITDPDLLICDEITSALDVSVQAVITELLCRLQHERGLALLFVTHNLAVVRGITQRILVMQGGQLAETGATESVMRSPQSAETRRLLRDAPRFTTDRSAGVMRA